MAIQLLFALPGTLQDQGLMGLLGGSRGLLGSGGSGLPLGLLGGNSGSPFSNILSGSDVDTNKVQEIIQKCFDQGLGIKECQQL